MKTDTVVKRLLSYEGLEIKDGTNLKDSIPVVMNRKGKKIDLPPIKVVKGEHYVDFTVYRPGKGSHIGFNVWRHGKTFDTLTILESSEWSQEGVNNES